MTTIEIDSEQSFHQWVRDLYQKYHQQSRVIFLKGDLGAGKSTFARVWLRCAGVKGRIKSPSFSIIETYEDTVLGVVHHVDCFRLHSRADVLSLGLDDEWLDSMLIEWPEHGFESLIEPDMLVKIEITSEEKRTCYVDFYHN